MLYRTVKLSGFLSDGQNVCRIVSVGSSKPDLQSIAVGIFEACMSFDIAVDMEWLPSC